MKNVLTYSTLNTFRNYPRNYKLRCPDQLRRPESPDALAFGSMIHGGLERWHRHAADEPTTARLLQIFDYLDAQFPQREGDQNQKHQWHVARSMFAAYAGRYEREDFEVVEIEKEFQAEIRNPETNRSSQTFVIAGKADGIVRLGGELYLLEHKTASAITSDYLDRLWTDTQIALYCHYLRELGYPIVCVIYNVLLKPRLKQRAGETPDAFEARRAALAAKNKSGRSTAKQQLPETDDAYRARLAAWYARPEAFHRERIYLSEDRIAMLQDELWEITQQYLDAKRRGKWLLNTSNCFSFQRSCEYRPYCQSDSHPNVQDNLFEVLPPHEELAELTVGGDSFAGAAAF